MGLSPDGLPITPYMKSWAQRQKARSVPQYNVWKDAHTKTWFVERFYSDGLVVKIGTDTKQKAAIELARAAAEKTNGEVHVERQPQ
jgi:hypothetical protein